MSLYIFVLIIIIVARLDRIWHTHKIKYMKCSFIRAGDISLFLGMFIYISLFS